MINKLKNPKTKFYEEIKQIILSGDFTWNYYPSTTLGKDNISFLSHSFLGRPEGTITKFPMVNSNYTDFVCQGLLEILSFNGIEVSTFFRVNANSVDPRGKPEYTFPHVDHSYQHSNILVYLTNSGGKTIVDDSEYDPKEDDVIMFDGNLEHYMETPLTERRVVIVATFLQYNK